MLIPLLLTAAPLLLSDTIPVPEIGVLGEPIDAFEVVGDAGVLGEPLEGFEFMGEVGVVPEPTEGYEFVGEVAMPELTDGYEFSADGVAPELTEDYEFAADGAMPELTDDYEFAGEAGVVAELTDSVDEVAVPELTDGYEFSTDGVVPEPIDGYEFASDLGVPPEPSSGHEVAGDPGVVIEPVYGYEAPSVEEVSEPSSVGSYSGLVLLGEPVRVPTYVREEPPPPPEPARPLPFQVHAAMPFPSEGLPGLPVHLVNMPVELGLTPSELERAVGSVYEELSRGQFPGAAMAIGRWGSTVIEQGFGTLDRYPGSPVVDPDYAIYDLASLTKVIATTTAVMLLHEDGLINLDMPVSYYLPAFGGPGKDAVTIRHLLTHTSGLPAGGDTSGPTPDASLWKAVTTPLKTRPGQAVEYSDIGFIVLWAAAESAYGAPLTELLKNRVFEPLEMHMTSFQPGESCIRCAPTADRPGFRGVVHDPIARRLGGIAGHAGLFSTVHDLSTFAAMLASRGELNGVRVFRPETIDLFTQRQPGAGVRALGWETPAPSGTGAGGIRISSNAFGHTGFTGTSLWVDPQRGTWVVLLSNRTYDSGPNRMQALRRTLNDRVATAVDQASD